jgi:hypothetical protein
LTIRRAIWPNAYRVDPASSKVEDLQKNIEGQFRNFQTIYLGAEFAAFSHRSVISGFRESRQYWKNADASEGTRSYG